jgi:hemerythrin
MKNPAAADVHGAWRRIWGVPEATAGQSPRRLEAGGGQGTKNPSGFWFSEFGARPQTPLPDRIVRGSGPPLPFLTINIGYPRFFSYNGSRSLRMSDEPGIFVEWDDRYSVGIPLIDEQHKELIRLTNELYLGCLTGDDEAREFFFNAVRGAMDYVKYHFSAEEKMMEKIKYLYLAEHRKRHEDFVLKLIEDVKSFQGGRKFVPNNFVRFLKDWILSHIAIEDIQYARYIMDLKRQGRLTGVLTD